MQNISAWPSDFDVSEPVARVLVDGQEVDVESVEVTAELGSAMPERVVAGGAIVAATGSVNVLRSDDVSEAGFNPWGDSSEFMNSSEVIVEAGYRDPDTGGVGYARQLTGQVESLGGSAVSSDVGMEIADHTPTLDRNITMEPLLARYPPLVDGGATRWAGLSPVYIRDRVLRYCGFYATPPMVSGSVLSVPLMGSAVPERGTFLHGEIHTVGNSIFRPTAWGVGLANGLFHYTPDLGSRGHGRLTSTLHVSFLREQSASDNPTGVTLNLRWGSYRDVIRVQAMSNGNMSVRYVQDGQDTRVVTLPAAEVNASEAFTVLVTPSGQATIYASNGASVTGTAPLPTVFSSQSMDEIHVLATGYAHPVSGVQVAFSSARIDGFQRTAHLDRPVHMSSLTAFPSQNKVNCLRLLKDQAEAEMAAMWIDEFGHFRWRSRVGMRLGSPVGTLTSKHHLLNLSWDIPVRSVFSRVEIEHEVAHVTLRNWASITVSDNRGSTLSNEDTEDRFFEPPADQDWHGVGTPAWMGASSTYELRDLRWGRGSYRGGVVVDDDQQERLSYSTNLVQSWHRIGPQKWLLSSAARGILATEYIEQSLLDRPSWYGKFAGDNLPIIRARGLVEWQDETTTGSARGPVLAPVFTHNVGPWVQGPVEAGEIADWLADQLTKPEPVLRRVPIVPDPRIQLGDVFWLEDQTAYHVRLRVIVMGKTLTYQATTSGYEMSQEITCRVIHVERIGVRYDELQTAWEGRDYAALAAAWTGQDYDALAADPLDRS